VCHEMWCGSGSGCPDCGASRALPTKAARPRQLQGTTDEVLRDIDRVSVGDADDTPVEQLVVDGAERKGVGNLVRAVGRPPPQVGGFDADRLAHELAVVPADRTTVFVGQ